MLARSPGPQAQRPDAAAEQFVRGFASCPDSARAAQQGVDVVGPAPLPHSEFRLTTVVPGVAVSIEVGGLSGPW